ncbi:aminoglycoside phosphotransferase family protein [Knoellia koreensis]|uniref:Kinase n=1 Tax=Knoellia koreensis TaxID=2730921 RepID=A0A849HC19_9MICO|nr:aminoglycoside phosphotransferase family protein [Knoellia sp. DB2414S]NNM45485.1 kinase [Knoellia sp. DB2414S]
MRTEDAAALVPAAFTEFVGRWSAEEGNVGGPSGAQWAADLPRLLAGVLDDWELTPTGPGRTGYSALVLPVERADGRAALKLAWPHLEARDEPLALRHWDGKAAVQLIAADPSRSVLLLEALDSSRDLTTVDIDTACAVIGGLLAQLHVDAPPGLRSVPEYVERVLTRMDALAGALPRRMTDRATGLLRDLTASGAKPRLLHTDLHFENVLASRSGTDRPPWLAIDPHAMAGHPGFEVQPLLRNRRDELGTGSAMRRGARRRLAICCEAAGIDEDEALGWTYLHTMMQAIWGAEGGDQGEVSFNIALLKALDD